LLDQLAEVLGPDFAVTLFHDRGRRAAVLEPIAHVRQGRDGVGVEHAVHRAAVGMAADDDVADLQHLDGILDRGRHAACLPRVRRWPTLRSSTAYRIGAVTPPACRVCGGTMLPALRMMKRSPGRVCVTRFGSMRESEQVMKSASGAWPFRSSSKSSRCFGKTF